MTSSGTADHSGDPARDALLQTEAETRAAIISDVSYELELLVDGDSPFYEGTCTIRFRCGDPSAGTFLDFTGGEVLRFEINGAAGAPAPHPHRLPLDADRLREANVVEVRYRNAYDTTGVGFHRFQDPEDSEVYLYTDFEPFNAHRLFPSFDQPDLKATWDLTVQAPQAWSVIANGAEVSAEATADGRVRRRFARLEPFSTYLFAVIAGPYVHETDTDGDIPLGVYCRKSLKPFLDHEEVFEITRQGLEFYTDYFGQPYPFGKYDQIFVPEYNSGAMENVGAVTFNESQVFRDPPTETQRLVRAEVVLHELAHMWFGNLVTMKWWDGLWLNESFATYISFLAMSEATRFQDCWENFLGSIKTWAYREDQKPTTHPIACTVEDTDQTFLNFDGITYGKGAAVLKQARAFLGDDGFRDGLRLYFRRHAWGNTTLGDFLGALGEGAGRDLTEWSKLWLETSGVNTIRPEVQGTGLSLIQEAGNGDQVLRPHHLEVTRYVRDDAGGLVAGDRWPLRVSGERTPIAVEGDASVAGLVWANQNDHAYARVLLDDASLACLESSLDRVDDPLTRMGLWCTLWEMLRDGALSPERYITLGARFLLAEDKPEILETNLRLVTVALRRYVRPEAQPDLATALLGALGAGLERHEAGSDRQLIWGRAAPGFVADAGQATALLSWLDEGAPADFPIDQGFRWRVLSRAAAFEIDGVQERLDEETRNDPSDRGVKARFAADAAVPDIERKRALFHRFVEPVSGDSADLLKAGMGAFFQPHQEAILRDLGLRYFDALFEVVENRDLEYASRGFARLLMPTAIAHPDLESAGRAALERAGAGAAPVLLRILLEEVDEMARAVRLRAL